LTLNEFKESPDETAYDEPAAPEPASAATGAKKPAAQKKEPGKKAPEPTTKKKEKEDEDLGPLMLVSDKQKRMNEERALKTLKWNFDVPRKEFVEQLRNQIEAAGFNKTLTTQLFHDDFKVQQTALGTLTRAISECSEAVISNLDLILRWLSLRFFETNPTVMLKAIEFQLCLFAMVIESKTHLSDFEANGFIPYFIGKFRFLEYFAL